MIPKEVSVERLDGLSGQNLIVTDVIGRPGRGRAHVLVLLLARRTGTGVGYTPRFRTLAPALRPAKTRLAQVQPW